MPSEAYQTLYRLSETLPVLSSHEHHRPDAFQMAAAEVLAHKLMCRNAARTCGFGAR